MLMGSCFKHVQKYNETKQHVEFVFLTSTPAKKVGPRWACFRQLMLPAMKAAKYMHQT